MNLNIQARLMAAVAQFKATHDIRYYLNGVWVEPCESGGAIIAATNGHALGMWRDPDGEVERGAILRIGKQLQAACAGIETKRLRIIDDRLVVVDLKGMELYVQNKEGTRSNSWEVDGKFPDWRKVIPDVDNGCVSMFDAVNSTYLTLVQKSIALGAGVRDGFCSISMRQKASNTAVLVTSNKAKDFVGVVMPLRQDVAPIPAWSRPAPTAVEEPAEVAA